VREKLLLLNRTLTLIGVAPFAVATLVPVHVAMDGDPLCPFRALTGQPCPLCGATRAFVLATHWDFRWLDYGAVWVVAALAILALGVTGRHLARAGTVLLAVGVVAWAWALAHASTITAG
jgi:hypothetical protein